MSKKILLLGAGRSSSTLIQYLDDHAEEYKWEIAVADLSEESAIKKTLDRPNTTALKLDIADHERTADFIRKSDLVISMLPANLHYTIAAQCVHYIKPMVTASYVSSEIKNLHSLAKDKGVLLLNEMGVDPGIDHMSAMKIIDQIKDKGGTVTGFESNTGGLVAPKYDNNPWNYKITWNPRNVVLAGKDGARFLHNGKYKYIPYHKLFRRSERIFISPLGEFEVYPNRDSLQYLEIYGLPNVETIFRGTVRRPGFCKAWNILVELGITSDKFNFMHPENYTFRDFTNSFLAWSPHDSVEEKLAKYLCISEDSSMMYKLRWLGLFDKRPINLENVTPADILQYLLEEKLLLEAGDQDMIVMQHLIDFEMKGNKFRTTSSMITYGENTVHTAMSKTVGLPVAIAAKNILNGTIKAKGVHIPTLPEIYLAVLNELETYNIRFTDETRRV